MCYDFVIYIAINRFRHLLLISLKCAKTFPDSDNIFFEFGSLLKRIAKNLLHARLTFLRSVNERGGEREIGARGGGEWIGELAAKELRG